MSRGEEWMACLAELRKRLVTPLPSTAPQHAQWTFMGEVAWTIREMEREIDPSLPRARAGERLWPVQEKP